MALISVCFILIGESDAGVIREEQAETIPIYWKGVLPISHT